MYHVDQWQNFLRRRVFAEKDNLDMLASDADTPARIRRRAQALESLRNGLSVRRTAALLHAHRHTVSNVRQKLNCRADELLRRDLRGPHPLRIKATIRRRIIQATLRERKRVELHPRRKLKFRLTTRSLAQCFGVSAMAVSRIWADAGLAPANRPDRRRTLSLNRVYIVGISAVGAAAIGISETPGGRGR